MKKYPFVKQTGLKDCGPACSLMIIKYYGGYVSLDKLCEIMKTNKSGTTAYHIIKAFRLFGFECDGFKYDDISLVSFPSIMHIKTNSYTHYVVIWKIDYKRNYVIVGDPFKGNINMKISDFISIWTGYTISMNPIKKIVKEEKPKVFSFLYNLIKPNVKYLIITSILSLFTVFFSIILSFFVQIIISNMNSNYLFLILVFFIFLMILNAVFNYFRNLFMVRFGNKLDKLLSYNTFSSIIRLPYEACLSKTTGETMSFYNDLFLIKSFALKIAVTFLIDIPIILFVSLYFFKNSFYLFLINIGFLILYLCYFLYNKKKVLFLSSEVLNSKSIVNSFITECVSGFESIRNLNIQSKMNERFKRNYDNYYDINDRYEYFRIKKLFFKDLFSNLYFILIVAICLNNSFKLFFTIYYLSSLFISSLENLFNYDFEFSEVISSISHIEYLSLKKLNKEENNFFGDISISNLMYSYDGIKNVLNNINLKIKKGEKILVSGESGSGKSTLFRIIKGFYDDYNGKVTIGKYDLKKYDFNNILYVSSEETLFTGRIIDNLNIRNLDFDRDMCEIDDFAIDNNVILENGFNLSSGQRQRIGLTRVGKFDILIIDEGLSCVDISMERRILKRLFKKNLDKTIIFISHRLDNLDLFERFIKLSSGKIIVDEVRNYERM
ncbi:MAG: ATP-binding cassette domain-containing protein [Bacilli bacterium]|nr:ATP-binding cassette domain-containing protein [Bacilli bacterium]